MNRVISEGDRVLVTPVRCGVAGKPYKATVIEWTPSGKLKMQPYNRVRQAPKIITSDCVKKLADKL